MLKRSIEQIDNKFKIMKLKLFDLFFEARRLFYSWMKNDYFC